MKFQKKLKDLNACHEAVFWCESFPSFEKAWEKCERGDWMLWVIGKKTTTEKQRKSLVSCACECARLSLKYVQEGEDRPLIAIEAAEKWAKNEEGISLRDVKYAAYAADAADAAAYAAAYVADAADAAYAKKETLKICADIVRKHFPSPPKL